MILLNIDNLYDTPESFCLLTLLILLYMYVHVNMYIHLLQRLSSMSCSY